MLFLNTPPWSSDRDPQGSFPRLQMFRLYESPYVFGGRAASGDQPDVPVGFTFRTQRYPRLCEALAGLLMPIIIAWTGATRKPSLAKEAFHCLLLSYFLCLPLSAQCKSLTGLLRSESLSLSSSLTIFYSRRFFSVLRRLSSLLSPGLLQLLRTFGRNNPKPLDAFIIEKVTEGFH